MRKLAVLAVCVGAFLVAPGIAAAETAQGKLTGSATVGGSSFAIGTTVVDGGTSYVGLENDKSDNCDGDGGTFIEAGLTYTVPCAHFVLHSRCCNAGSPKMRFAYGPVITVGGAPFYRVVRITDNAASTDTFALGITLHPLADARAWVNRGLVGSGLVLLPWTFFDVTAGGFTVTP